MILSSISLLPLATLAAIITLVLQRRHILIALLALEGIILTLIIIIILIYPGEIYSALIVLTFGACEARLGLACLVAITRTYGTDLFSSLSVHQC